MRRFAGFEAAEQRFIRRSLDVGLGRGDPVDRWSRSQLERAEIERQAISYRQLDIIRSRLDDCIDPGDGQPFLEPLIALSASDLAQGRLGGFNSFHFLYERLVGEDVRPWLVSAFCAAAALPSLHPELRARLLQSIPLSEAAAAGWSIRAPLFFPEWIEPAREEVN